MKTYSVKPEGFKAVRKRMLITGISTLSIAFIGAALLLSGGGLTPFGFGLLFIVVFVFGGIGMRRGMRHQQETWSSYTLTLGDGHILKQQSYHPDTRVDLNEITAIQKAYTGDLVVETKSWRKFILVPKGLNGFDEVEQYLAALKPIKKQSAAVLFASYSLGAIIFFSLVTPVHAYLQSHSPSLLAIFVFVNSMLIISFFLLMIVRRLPGIDERSIPKRRHFILLIGFVLLTVVSYFIFFALGSR